MSELISRQESIDKQRMYLMDMHEVQNMRLDLIEGLVDKAVRLLPISQISEMNRLTYSTASLRTNHINDEGMIGNTLCISFVTPYVKSDGKIGQYNPFVEVAYDYPEGLKPLHDFTLDESVEVQSLLQAVVRAHEGGRFPDLMPDLHTLYSGGYYIVLHNTDLY
jgi:hypothetical protein